MSEKPPQPKVTIETGHRYVLKDEINSVELEKEFLIADRITAALAEKGYVSTKLILLDDTIPKANSEASALNSDRWNRFIGRYYSYIENAKPEDCKIVSENDFIPRGRQIVEEVRKMLRENPKGSPFPRLSGKDDQRIKVGTKKGLNFPLIQSFVTTSNIVVEMPSCPVLDMAVYEEKLKEAEITITVLPERFKEQQAEVRALFQIVNDQEPNIIVVYFNPDSHTIESIEAWNDKIKTAAQDLLEALAHTQ